jgi:hypothetical protein
MYYLMVGWYYYSSINRLYDTIFGNSLFMCLAIGHGTVRNRTTIGQESEETI